MEQDFQSVLVKFWQTIRQRGKGNPVHTVFSVGEELLNSTESRIWRQSRRTLGLALSSLGLRSLGLSNNSAAVALWGWMRFIPSSWKLCML